MNQPGGPDSDRIGDPVRRRVSRRRAVLTLAAVGLGVLAADQLTKHLTLEYLSDREPLRLLGGAVYLTVTRNSGAAFSFGSEFTYVFPIVAAVVVGWIAWLARRLRSLPWAVALGLVLGGALGNLADRLFRAPGPLLGHVVDMVSVFDPHGRVFPVFNLADSALTVGVALAILLEMTGRMRDGTRLRRNGPPPDAGGAAPAEGVGDAPPAAPAGGADGGVKPSDLDTARGGS